MTRRCVDQTPDIALADTFQVRLVRESACHAPVDVAARGDTCAIAVMAKASTPGLVKTRLCPPLSIDQAAELNTAFLADVLENLALAGRRTAMARYLSFGPPGSASFFERRFPTDVGLMEVWFANFGDCLFQTIDRLFTLGHGAACVLNSDSPTLPTASLVETARLLAAPGDRAVLGPALDGGYYLLGLKAPHRHLFEDIDWSTGVVAQQTRERAAEIGLEVVTLQPWYDVDDEQMLRKLIAEISGTPGDTQTTESYAAPHTRRALEALGLSAFSEQVTGPSVAHAVGAS